MCTILFKYTFQTENSRAKAKGTISIYVLEPDDVVGVGSTGHSSVQVDITTLPAYRG